MEHSFYTLILAGGYGTRLKPLSTKERPKQFLSLVSDQALLADTYDRVKFFSPNPVYVSCLKEHEHLVSESLLCRRYNTVLEQFPRGTLIPILKTCLSLVNEAPDSLLLVTPSDHYFSDVGALRSAINSAVPLARSGSIVSFGVPAVRPDSSLGYIKANPLSQKIEHFVEKPELSLAQCFVEQGYYWNTGLLLFKISSFLDEACRLCSDLVCKLSVSDSVDAAGITGNYSVDTVVLENIISGKLVIVRSDWSDLGTWESLVRLHTL